MDETDLLRGRYELLPRWSPPARTKTARGAFDQCKQVSAAYTAHLQAHGHPATWVQVRGARVPFPAADHRWSTLDPQTWHHYVTRIGDLFVDFTMRQFDPTAAHPYLCSVASLTRTWGGEATVTDTALHQYLATRR